MLRLSSDPGNRRAEAERLIGLARAMLGESSEQLVVDYLDHAAEALRDLPLPVVNAADRPRARDPG